MSNTPHRVTVRKYGLLQPLDWGEDCEDQLRKMTALWNTLVEIERGHRERYLAATAADPAVTATQGRLDGLTARRAEIDAERKARRKAARAKIATPDLDAALAALKPQIAEAAAAAKKVRKAARERVKPALAALDDERKAAVKAARQTANADGCWWSNANAVLASFETARARSLKDGAELRFRRHDGSGRLVNQIQGGIDEDDLFTGARNQLRVAPVDADAWSITTRGLRKRATRTTLTATVFSRGREGRRTVTWPMVMHRPLPDGARIQEVTVTRRRVADRWRWEVVFLCRVPDTRLCEAPGACGIDVGWRMTDEGLRVAMLVDDMGAREALHLPHALLRGHEIAAEQSAARDRAVNEMMAALRALDPGLLPDPLRAALGGLRKAPRIGPRALARLERLWRADHREAMPETLAALSLWAGEDRRMWRAHAGLVGRLARRRTDLYRNFAARVAARYGLIGIEALDQKSLMSRGANGAEPVMTGGLRNVARIAAPAELLTAIRQAAEAAGARIHRHEGVSTWICHACGAAVEPADAAALHQRCGCGTTWDQDVNAAHNLLAAARASAPAMSETQGPLAAKKPRWIKAREQIAARKSGGAAR